MVLILYSRVQTGRSTSSTDCLAFDFFIFIFGRKAKYTKLARVAHLDLDWVRKSCTWHMSLLSGDALSVIIPVERQVHVAHLADFGLSTEEAGHQRSKEHPSQRYNTSMGAQVLSTRIDLDSSPREACQRTWHLSMSLVPGNGGWAVDHDGPR